MAQLKLNTTQSIVDLFKSKGLDSGFATRERVFKNLGLENRLGIYTGGERQNPAFIRALGNFNDEQIKGALKSPVSAAPPVAEPLKEPGISVPPQLKDVIPEGTTAADALKILGIPEAPSAEQISQQVQESPAFKLFQEKQEVTTLSETAAAEAKKGTLEKEFVGDIATLENNLASRGLTFSGVKTSAIKSLTDSLAASQLGVDRALASKLLSQSIDLKEQVLKTAEQVIKDAQVGRKEATQFLKDIGLAVSPNGKIVPTLAAQAQEATQERFKRTAERLERAADRGTVAQQRTAELGNIQSQLNTTVGLDGFVDADLYQRLRATATVSASDFDNRFKSLLSPENRVKLGVKGGDEIDDKLDAYGL